MARPSGKTQDAQAIDLATGRAVSSPGAWVCFLAVLAAGVAADLISKSSVFDFLVSRPGETVTVLPGFLRLSLSTNPGIVFGIRAPSVLVLGATVLAMVVVAYLFATSPRRSRFLHVALAMVLGGSLGNAYDRLFSRVLMPGDDEPRVGQVRDFIDAYYQTAHWPTFNVADMLLVVGVAMILLQMMRTGKKPLPPTP